MKEILSYHDYFKKDLRVILIVLSVLSIIGNASDIFLLFNKSDKILVINSLNILANILLLSLHFKNKISVKTALAISIYVIAGNFIFSQLMDFPRDNSIVLFMRATMFIALMVTISAIGVGKFHAIILSFFFIVFYVFLTITTHNTYLEDSMVLIFIAFFAYNVVNYFFVSNIHNAIEKLQIQNQIITEQKDSLEESYWEQEETHTILQRKNEELILAKEKAEESDHLKSAFLANMSHEIRTPMNGILGFATLLKKPSLSDEKQLKYIKAIEQSGRRMLNIINDIIDISRIEAGQTELNLESVEINQVIDDLLLFFKPEAEQNNIRLISYKSNYSEELYIQTDKNKLIQILTNLIKNAIKFTKIGQIEYGYKLGSNNIEFYISDTGIGIHPDFHQKIFERFRQAETNLASQYEGSGLGLSISKAYIELLGGKIWLKSEINKGSTFFFTLPKKDFKNIVLTNNTTINNIVKIEKLKKILIAEDDEISYLFLSELIDNENISLIRAHNGNEAVELAKSNSDIDLIFMDIKMPELDGYEAFKQIKFICPHVPIVAQTAYVMQDDKNKAMNAGFNDYISKPIQVESLNKLLIKYLQ